MAVGQGRVRLDKACYTTSHQLSRHMDSVPLHPKLRPTCFQVNGDFPSGKALLWPQVAWTPHLHLPNAANRHMVVATLAFAFSFRGQLCSVALPATNKSPASYLPSLCIL